VSRPVSTASASAVRASVSKSTPVSDSSLSDVISKYLVQYVPPSPAKTKGSTRVTGSRVLKSDEGMLFYMKKRRKENREGRQREKKQEREDKERQKDKLSRKKAEER